MPILVAVLKTSPPSPPEPIEVGSPWVAWEDPTGVVTPLTERELGWYMLRGAAGLLFPALSMSTQAVDGGGITVTDIQPTERVVQFRMRVGGSTHVQFQQRVDELGDRFHITSELGPGWLIVQRPDGQVRRIRAYYQSGFEGTTDDRLTAATFPVTLVCESPYWEDVDELAEAFEFDGGAPRSFYAPFFTVGRMRSLGSTVATNRGRVTTFPRWVFTGPAALITVTNLDTGEAFELDPNAVGIAHGNLLAGETVTVYTKPAQIIGPDGTPWTAAVNFPDSVLWPLRPGANRIEIDVVSAAAGTSAVVYHRARHKIS